MRYLFTCVLISTLLSASAQDEKGYKGHFSLGLRSTTSLFSHDQSPGIGTGGQFRIGVAKRINTEWFLDYIRSGISDVGNRKDVHIGWSVMFYPFNLDAKVVPFVVAGHCFDYTKIAGYQSDITPVERWSSATQAGLGINFPIKETIDLTLQSQYMVHLGNTIHYHVEESGNQKWLNVEEGTGTSLEGHMLVTLSLNVYLSELWSKE